MKDFRDFDPLHPFHFEETLQIKNRKIKLSYIPLVDSVSVRGYVPAETPSDIRTNSFWTDYRFDDGYRSANGEVIFDSSSNDRYVEVSYFGIGTALHAEDMREVAESLDSIQKQTDAQSQNISDLGIKIRVVAENSQDLIESHSKNPVAHQTLIDSIQSTRDSFDYRLNTQESRLDGFLNLLNSTAESLQSQIQYYDQLNDSQLQEVESRLEEKIKSESEIFEDFRDEFTGIYNMINLLDDKYSVDREETVKNVESLLALERVSFITSINNAKSEVLSRTVSEMQAGDESLRQELKNIRETTKEDFADVYDIVDSIDSKIDSVAGDFPLIRQILDSETHSRIASDNQILDSMSNSFDSLSGTVANLADILYQARQATNIQMESLRANVAIAEDNLVATRRDLESLKDAASVVDSLQADVFSYLEAQISPFKEEFSQPISEMQSAIQSQRTYMGNYFSKIEESIAAVWDGVDEKIGDIDFSEYETSIANNSASISTNSSNISKHASSISGLNTRINTLEGRQSAYIIGTTARSETGGIWRV